MRTNHKGGKGIIAPPLLIYALTTAAALAAHKWMPVRLLPFDLPVIKAFGIVIALASAVLPLSAFIYMRRVKTTVNPYKTASSLVTGGPFRITRNPMYLSLLLLYPGLSLMLNSLWMAASGAVFLAVMHYGVILREEAALIRKFGGQYEEYMKKVRRWL